MNMKLPWESHDHNVVGVLIISSKHVFLRDIANCVPRSSWVNGLYWSTSSGNVLILFVKFVM